MCVCNRGHSVHLEVFVGADWRCILNWTPIREWRFRIIEPLIAEVAHMISINVRNSLRDFRPCNSSVQIEHLWTDLLHDVRRWLNGHEFVPEGVTSANYLHIVHVVRVYGRLTHATVVHLPRENFISEEPVTENTTIAIWRIKALLSCDINKLAQKCMHSVVLLAHIIQMLCVSVNLVTSKDSLQEEERVEVGMFPAGSIIEHPNWRVNHFIVPDHH